MKEQIFEIMSEGINLDNTPSVATTVTTAVVANSGIYTLLVDSLPFLWVGLFLCLSSVCFGISKAKAKNEQITVKKCLDGFIGKIIKYSCWSLLGCSLALAFQVLWLKYVVIAAVYLIELDGIYENYCDSKGIQNRVHFSTLFYNFLKNKFGINDKEEKEK